MVKIETTFDITIDDDYLLIKKMSGFEDICNYIKQNKAEL